MTNPQDIPKWQETGKRLRNRQRPGGRKSIAEMDLEEALKAQELYLVWVEKYPEHSEREVKRHIYENYLLPHIANLMLAKNVVDGLGINPPTETSEPSQLSIV